ncbi:hypothetical protein T01_9917 [Trichinella spiralis]|uniref:Uncharacterized protein n=1 Tax=Trichinella spiralis TaxID=6334 RepID=A0A0V1BM96_TRISP|nr:hypothetical protein T01_9917 [Trichinella spiralis]
MIYVNAIDDVVEKAGCERNGQQASLEKKIAALNGLVLTLAHPHLVASCILCTVVEVERKSEQD